MKVDSFVSDTSLCVADQGEVSRLSVSTYNFQNQIMSSACYDPIWKSVVFYKSGLGENKPCFFSVSDFIVCPLHMIWMPIQSGHNRRSSALMNEGFSFRLVISVVAWWANALKYDAVRVKQWIWVRFEALQGWNKVWFFPRLPQIPLCFPAWKYDFSDFPFKNSISMGFASEHFKSAHPHIFHSYYTLYVDNITLSTEFVGKLYLKWIETSSDRDESTHDHIHITRRDW